MIPFKQRRRAAQIQTSKHLEEFNKHLWEADFRPPSQEAPLQFHAPQRDVTPAFAC